MHRLPRSLKAPRPSPRISWPGFCPAPPRSGAFGQVGMRRFGIPTAKYIRTTDVQTALDYVRSIRPGGVVVKVRDCQQHTPDDPAAAISRGTTACWWCRPRAWPPARGSSFRRRSPRLRRRSSRSLAFSHSPANWFGSECVSRGRAAVRVSASAAPWYRWRALRS